MKRITLSILLFFSNLSFSAPFNTCPTQAFLFQGNPTTVFGINLASGKSSILQANIGVMLGKSKNGSVNAVGFDNNVNSDGTSDRYIYGFNTISRKFVKVDASFKQTELPVYNPNNLSPVTGDVFQRYYYFYKRDQGLFKFNLDPTASDYLVIQTVNDTLDERLADFAFHPRTEKIYGVSNTGILYEIDPVTGTNIDLGSIGYTGTLGASYFDSAGFFYVSRNIDGKIFRINLSNISTPADDTITYPTVEFANGPIAAQNDGARCATAPLVDNCCTVSTIDFGDAPESYGTTMAGNGARHEIIPNGPYLGSNPPDGEVDAKIGVLSDNSNDDTNNISDEDGVSFGTGLIRGLTNTIQVNASKSGFLNAWIDWNRDGDFEDANEHVFNNQLLITGNNSLAVNAPLTSGFGPSWARFRFGSQVDISFNGGAIDGEVEDYAIEVSDLGMSYQYYPASGSFVTLAFEDKWPIAGDYDMNDVVFHYRSTSVISAGKLRRVDIHGQLLALGSDYHHGFAIRIPGVQASAVDTSTMSFKHIELLEGGGEFAISKGDPVEPLSNELIAVITPDIWDLVTTSCDFYRTNHECMDPIQFGFELSLPFTDLQDASTISSLYDPFIFATENRNHGDTFPTPPGRELEIHLVDMPPTELANPAYLGIEDDDSDPALNRYYISNNNLPWSMEIGTEWKHPRSGVDLLQAYPLFEGYINSIDTEVVVNDDWYLPDNRADDKSYP